MTDYLRTMHSGSLEPLAVPVMVHLVEVTVAGVLTAHRRDRRPIAVVVRHLPIDSALETAVAVANPAGMAALHLEEHYWLQ